jgi:hypothetical protein
VQCNTFALINIGANFFVLGATQCIADVEGSISCKVKKRNGVYGEGTFYIIGIVNVHCYQVWGMILYDTIYDDMIYAIYDIRYDI